MARVETTTIRVLCLLAPPENELLFKDLPVSTTLGELKLRLRDQITSKPSIVDQRIIRYGRVLADEMSTLADIIGEEALRQHSEHVFHLVLRDSQSSRTVNRNSLDTLQRPASAEPSIRRSQQQQQPFPAQTPHLNPNMNVHPQNLAAQFLPQNLPHQHAFVPQLPRLVNQMQFPGMAGMPGMPALVQNQQPPNALPPMPVPPHVVPYMQHALAFNQQQNQQLRAQMQGQARALMQQYGFLQPQQAQRPANIDEQTDSTQRINVENSNSTSTAQPFPTISQGPQGVAEPATGGQPPQHLPIPRFVPAVGPILHTAQFQPFVMPRGNFSNHLIPPSNQVTAYLLNSPEGPYALVYSPPTASLRRQAPSPNIESQSRAQAVVRNPTQHDQHRLQHFAPPAAGGEPDFAQPPLAQNRLNDNEGNVMAVNLTPFFQALWLFIRVYGVMWLFLGGGSRTWARTALLVIMSIFYWAYQAGLFAEPLQYARRYWDGLLRAPTPEARGAENVGQVNGQYPATREGAASATQALDQGAFQPQDAANRLLNDRREQDRDWFRERMRGVERALALFIASLLPGVGERHIAEREREIRADQERMRQAERERDSRREQSDGNANEERNDQEQDRIAPVDRDTRQNDDRAPTISGALRPPEAAQSD